MPNIGQKFQRGGKKWPKSSQSIIIFNFIINLYMISQTDLFNHVNPVHCNQVYVSQIIYLVNWMRFVGRNGINGGPQEPNIAFCNEADLG